MRYVLIALSLAVLFSGPFAVAALRAGGADGSPATAIVADEATPLLDGIDWDEWLLLEGIDWDEWLLGLICPAPAPTRIT